MTASEKQELIGQLEERLAATREITRVADPEHFKQLAIRAGAEYHEEARLHWRAAQLMAEAIDIAKPLEEAILEFLEVVRLEPVDD